MAVFNYQKKEIDAKIVYYGPGISGKTTNLQHIHQHLKPEQRGKMVSLATDEERTLFFDFLPIELESVRGFRTRFHLYTVPGQVYYGATRRAVLTGADGIIFVADSQRDRLEDNLISIKDLEENLHYYGRKTETIPLIIQYNKRDLPNVLPLDELNSKLNRLNVPHFESVAILGKGVFETLTMMCRMVLKTIEDGAEARKPSPSPQPPAAAAEAPVRRATLEKRPAPAPTAGAPSLPKAPSLASASTLRLERSAERQAPARPEPVRAEPRPPLAEKPGEKPVAALEPAGVPGISPMRRPPAAAPHFEAPRVPKVGQVVTPRVEEEKKKGNGKGFFSRMFGERQSEAAPAVEPKPEPGLGDPSDRGLRISSCGQPRLTGSGGVEIPLTLEMSVNGREKMVAVDLKVTVQMGAPPNQES